MYVWVHNCTIIDKYTPSPLCTLKQKKQKHHKFFSDQVHRTVSGMGSGNSKVAKLFDCIVPNRRGRSKVSTRNSDDDDSGLDIDDEIRLDLDAGQETT
jgi:hypothetical protein